MAQSAYGGTASVGKAWREPVSKTVSQLSRPEAERYAAKPQQPRSRAGAAYAAGGALSAAGAVYGAGEANRAGRSLSSMRAGVKSAEVLRGAAHLHETTLMGQATAHRAEEAAAHRAYAEAHAEMPNRVKNSHAPTVSRERNRLAAKHTESLAQLRARLEQNQADRTKAAGATKHAIKRVNVAQEVERKAAPKLTRRIHNGRALGALGAVGALGSLAGYERSRRGQ